MLDRPDDPSYAATTMVRLRRGKREPVIVLTTTERREEAREIALALVDAGLAGCVNVVPHITSVYRWEGETKEEPEVLLVIKTRTDRLTKLEAWLTAHHSYELPEFLVVEKVTGSPRYLRWLTAAAAPSQEGDG